MNGEITSIKVNGDAQPIENHSVNIETGALRVSFTAGEETGDGFPLTANCTGQEIMDAYLAGKEINATLTLSAPVIINSENFYITDTPLNIFNTTTKQGGEPSLSFTCIITNNTIASSGGFCSTLAMLLRFSPLVFNSSSNSWRLLNYISIGQVSL